MTVISPSIKRNHFQTWVNAFQISCANTVCIQIVCEIFHLASNTLDHDLNFYLRRSILFNFYLFFITDLSLKNHRPNNRKTINLYSQREFLLIFSLQTYKFRVITSPDERFSETSNEIVYVTDFVAL